MIDTALMAIAQINQLGGVLGQYLELLVVDGTSNLAEFKRRARNPLQSEPVAPRKAAQPAFEELNTLPSSFVN